VGGERHVIGHAHVAAERTDHLTGLRVPNLDLPVGPATEIAGDRSQLLAVPTKGHTHDRCAMPAQGTYFLPGPCIPDLQACISTGRRDALPVWTVSHAPVGSHRARKRTDFLACGRVPDPHVLIIPGGSEVLTIWTERHRRNGGAVSAQV